MFISTVTNLPLSLRIIHRIMHHSTPQMPNCVMLFVPLHQFGIRYFDQFVRDRSIVKLEDGLSKLVSLPLREEVDPYIVINAAQNKPFSLDSI